MEFWREFVEDGACCDRVSPGESERWEPGKLRTSCSPRRAAGSGTAEHLASRGRGGGVPRDECGSVWPCAARSAPRLLGLLRVRTGGGGEARGCGLECGRARGARGRRDSARPSRRRPRALSPGPSQLCSSRLLPPPRRASAPGPERFVFPAVPRDSLPPVFCFAALGALSNPSRPASLLHLLPSVAFLPCPFVAPLSFCSVAL